MHQKVGYYREDSSVLREAFWHCENDCEQNFFYIQGDIAMISKDAFKELVLAGAITVKNVLAIKRMEEIIEDNLDDDEDDPLLDEVFEIARKCSFTQPFSHIVSCIA